MGAGASLTEASTNDEIAQGVSSLGGAFGQYAEIVRENGVDGELLKNYTTDHSPSELLDDLEISNNLHRTKIILEINKIFKGTNETSVENETQNLINEERSNDNDPFSELIKIAEKIEARPICEFVKIEDVNHMFISYRHATETQLGTRLYNGVRAIVADRDFAVAGQKPKIFFDRKSLDDGEKWEAGFVKGVLSSLILLPLISWEGENGGSVGRLMRLPENDAVDNVLLEWELGLLLLDMRASGGNKSLMRSIFPIIVSDTDERGFLPFPFEKLSSLPDKPSLKTKTKLVEICMNYGIPCNAAAITRSVKDVVYRIVENQGVKLEDLGKEEVAIETCAGRIFDKASQTVLEIGLENSNSKKEAGMNDEDLPEATSLPGLPPPLSVAATPYSVAEASEVQAQNRLSASVSNGGVVFHRTFTPVCTTQADLGMCTLGSPFSVECFVEIQDPGAAPMYARIWKFDEVSCFTNGGTEDYPKPGIWRVKVRNDNDTAIGFHQVNCLGKNRKTHLVMTCNEDGFMALYMDGKLVAPYQRNAVDIPLRSRKIEIGHDSQWIHYRALTIYSTELTADQVSDLACKVSAAGT